jgi:hypothetical protein
MPKKIDDIIAPTGRKSIRSIPIPEARRINIVDSTPKGRGKQTETNFDEPIMQRPRSSFGRTSSGGKYSKKFLWIGASLGVIILAFAVFSLFSGATVTYTPATSALVFNKDTYTAYKTGDKVLLFSVIKLSGDKGVKTPASGEENVSIKAEGTIVVYNNTSKADQKLIKNTRFETPEGKVYRIPNEIVVPGQKTVDGALVPGSVEARVVADVAGAEYNIDLSDFTIPGFKGDPRFTTIYARSKTPMTGGFVGTRKKVSEDDLAAANTSLQTSLKNELISQAEAQTPPDFIIFPNLVYITYSNLPQTNATDKGVTVNLHGDLYGVMFKRIDLANFLASKKLPGLSSPVEIPDLNTLDLSFIAQGAKDLLKADQLSFQVAGPATAVYLTDENALKKDLASKNKKELDSILKKSYPTILEASAVVRPFWKSVFPTDTTSIKIIENQPNKK